MFAKFLLIALVCVSFAQVHGGQLENAINSGLRKARAMNENAKDRLMEANRGIDDRKHLIFYKTTQFVQKGNRVQEGSRQSLRNIAYAMEKKAEQNSRPDSVFQCIRRNELRANREIQAYTSKFATDMERLKTTKLNNINTAAEALMGLEDDLEVRYLRAVTDVNKCQNTRCVYVVIGSYSTYLNSFYANVRRVEGQTGTILGNFQRDANNYFTNSNRQITRIRSAAIRNIRNCYFRGERDFLLSEDSQDSEECQECQESQESQETQEFQEFQETQETQETQEV